MRFGIGIIILNAWLLKLTNVVKCVFRHVISDCYMCMAVTCA